MMDFRKNVLSRSGEVRRRSQNAPLLSDFQPDEATKAFSSRSPAVSFLGIAIPLLVLFTLFYLSSGIYSSSALSSYLPFHNNVQPLDTILHPSDHINRAPTVLEYKWDVTQGSRRPDGVKKNVYLINNEFPGPTIEARSGDTLRIFVRNLMKDEGVAFHWHGLSMRDALEMDGATGLTQCPIAPGRSFTYEFNISHDQHGTFWYHAHEQVQRADGLYGGLIVYPPESSGDLRKIPQYDEDRLLLIGDWYHRSADEVVAWYLQPASFGNEPVPDSVLINRGGHYNCSMAVPARPIDCDQRESSSLPRIDIDRLKRYRFRVINTGTLAGFTLTIPDAHLLAVEVDGGHGIEAHSAHSLGIIYPSERLDFIATWDSKSSHFDSVLRIELDDETFRYSNLALSPIHKFPIALSSMDPSQDFTQPTSSDFFNLTGAKPSDPLAIPLPETADTTLLLYITSQKLAHLHNVPHGFLNQTTWLPQASPPKPLISLPSSEWDTHQFVPYIDLPDNSPKWVDIILNNLDDSSHPFHLHGYDFWILQTYVDGSYWGSYNPYETPEGPPGGPLNLINPLKRDTVIVPWRGYAVIRFLADNPGIWMFHCHILWHQASGMAMGLQVGGDRETPFIADWEPRRRDNVEKLCS